MKTKSGREEIEKLPVSYLALNLWDWIYFSSRLDVVLPVHAKYYFSTPWWPRMALKLSDPLMEWLISMCSCPNNVNHLVTLDRSQSLDFSPTSTSSPSGDVFLQTDPLNFRSLPPIPEYEYYSGDGEGDLSHASHSDLAFEWSMLCQECPECWTRTGRTLSLAETQACHCYGDLDVHLYE